MRVAHLNILFELICLCISLFFLRKNRDTFSMLTIGYLTLVVITEISGALWIKIYHKNNSWIYNIYSIFMVSYVCLGFYHLLSKKIFNSFWLVLLSYLIFLISYATETFYHGFFKYHIFSITIISVCFTLLSLVYFFKLIRQDKIYNLQYYSSFWWVAAILIYFFGCTMYNLFVFYAVKYNKGLHVLVYTMIVLNFLLYSIWSYSYICSSRHRKLLPSLQ